MRFFPYITQEFYSPFLPEEIAAKIRSSIVPITLASLFRKPPMQSFRGNVSARGFHLRYAAKPSIDKLRGWITPDPTGRGSRVRVRHRLPWFIFVFAGISLTTLLLSFFRGILQLLTTGYFNVNSLASIFPVMIMSSLVLIPFWSAFDKSNWALKHLLKLENLPAESYR